MCVFFQLFILSSFIVVGLLFLYCLFLRGCFLVFVSLLGGGGGLRGVNLDIQKN